MFRSRSLFASLIALILLLSACAPAEPEISQEELQQTIEVVVGMTALAQSQAEAAATDEPTAEPPTATLEPTPSVVVVFTPGGLFDDAKRAEFYARILNPFIDYYAEETANNDHPRLVSVHVETYDTPDYPYGAEAIFEGGVYIGWLIPETNGVVDVWAPDCMNGPCPLSQDYINQYPDTAATVQAQ